MIFAKAYSDNFYSKAQLPQPQLHLNSTPPQLNSKIWHENDLRPPPPSTQTQWHQYLSCSWPNFNQILKIGLWDQQRQKQQQHEQQKQQPQDQEQQKQHLIYYWPDFDETFNGRFLELNNNKNNNHRHQQQTRKQKQQQQQKYLSYYWPNFY